MNNVNFGNWLKTNLPSILTVGACVSAIVTAGVAVYEGMKLKEELMELPEDAPTKKKVVVVARRAIPVVVGASLTVGCAVGAHHEHVARYTALLGTCAALKADKEDLTAWKDKAKEVLGEKKAEKVDEEVKQDHNRKIFGDMNPARLITVHDLKTGFVFNTTLADFDDTRRVFNADIDKEAKPLEEFFINLPGVSAVGLPDIYGDIQFGGDTDVHIFDPTWGLEFGPNREPIYTIRYDYDVVSSDLDLCDRCNIGGPGVVY